MTELELEHEIFITKAELEKQRQVRERITKHAKSENDQDLSWSIVEECAMIRRAHSDAVAYNMF